MAGERGRAGFGGKLREARERRGISLGQIAAATKISVTALEALEHNDISRLPGGIFTRSFVRSYAVQVGLDPEATVQEFLAEFPSDSVTAGHRMAERSLDQDAFESNRRTATAFLWLVAVSIPITAAVLYFGVKGRHTTAAHPASPSVDQLGRPGAAESGTPAPPVDEHFAVGITVSAPSVVSIAVDDGEAIAQPMQAGDHQEWQVRREIVLTTSDAAGVALTLDGAPARPLGKAGEPATVRLTPSNFKDYVAVQ